MTGLILQAQSPEKEFRRQDFNLPMQLKNAGRTGEVTYDRILNSEQPHRTWITDPVRNLPRLKSGQGDYTEKLDSVLEWYFAEEVMKFIIYEKQYFEYDSLGRCTRWSFQEDTSGTGSQYIETDIMEYSYNSKGTVTSLELDSYDGSYYKQRFTYDHNGNIIDFITFSDRKYF